MYDSLLSTYILLIYNPSPKVFKKTSLVVNINKYNMHVVPQAIIHSPPDMNLSYAVIQSSPKVNMFPSKPAHVSQGIPDQFTDS